MFTANFFNYRLIFVFCLITLTSCSTKKKSWVSRQYHNTTARYNGYFNGNQSVKQGIKKIQTSFNDDYTQILPIFKTGDLSKSKVSHSFMDKAIQKASVVIQKHSIKIRGKEYCKWIDDNYFLLGKSYFFKGEFEESIKAFSFIKENFKKNEIIFLADIWMAKCFIEKEDYASAENILIEIDNNKKFPKKYKKDFLIVSADSYMRQKNYPLAIDNINSCIKVLKSKKQKTRLNFILGQLYQDLENFSQSSKYYKLVLDSSPEYIMTFNAKMNLALSSNNKNKDYQKLRKSLVKMSKDDKNKEYLDQIYYTLAKMDILSEDTVSSKSNYLLSTLNSIDNDKQKGLSFLSLADINLIQKDYLQSKIYYDSTIFFLPSESLFYEKAKQRQEFLSNLDFYLNAVLLQDSLQQLALLPKNQLSLIIAEIINAEIEEERIRLEEERDKQQNMLNNNRGSRNEQFGNNTSGGKWYFYNPATLSFGLSEFRKIWSKRKLEDNWRRSNKNSESDFISDSTQNPLSNRESLNTKDPEYYLSQIPSTLEDFLASNETIISSCFQASMIYKQDLNRYDKANEMLMKILQTKNVDSNYIAMTLYSLHQNYLFKQNNNQAKDIKLRLLIELPNSIYAKLLSDSTYVGRIEQIKKKEQIKFESLLKTFNADDFKAVIKSTRTILENEFSVKYKFLRALSYLKINDTLSFLTFAEEIKNKYPQTKISKEIEEILIILKDPSSMLESNEKAINKSSYLLKDAAPHILAIILPREGVDVNYLKTIISDYHLSSLPNDIFEISAILLGDSQHLLTIKTFESKKKSLMYYEKLLNSNDVMLKVSKSEHIIMTISLENFKEFYKNQDVKGYLDFFNNNYL
tara:strand:+ start:11440 stop:14016 length:2577 start_codon:yes stop_codon:yes gene_type:complete